MSQIQVCFSTFWSSFDCPGGGEVQLLRTEEELKKLGVHVGRFDLWSPSLDRFDLVHAFTIQPGMSYFCEFIKNRGSRLVLSPIFWPRLGATRGEMWELERSLRFADLILPNSNEEATLISKLFDVPMDKFHVVHNGVDLSYFKKTDPNLFIKKFGLSQKFLLCVGNVEPRKNQLGTLRAIQNSKIGLPLVSVGSVRDQAYLEECKKFGSNFVHVGSVPYGSDLLASAYCAAQAFVLASSFETPGLSAMEALHLGCPVLITNRGSTKEYFKNNAVYVDPDDLSSISSGLVEIQKRIGPSFKSSFSADNYSWKKAAEETKRAYEKVLSL